MTSFMEFMGLELDAYKRGLMHPTLEFAKFYYIVLYCIVLYCILFYSILFYSNTNHPPPTPSL